MRRKYIPPAVSVSSTSAQRDGADAGTDTTRITTKAARKGDSYVINGPRPGSPRRRVAEGPLLTRTTPLAECARRTDGMTLFFADLDPKHVTIKPIRKLGRHAVSSNDVFFDDLVVPVEDRVGEEGKGFKYLLDGLNPERILVAFEAIGVGRAEPRVRYAGDRSGVGRPIGRTESNCVGGLVARLAAAELAAQKRLGSTTTAASAEPKRTSQNTSPVAGFKPRIARFTHGGYGYAEFHVSECSGRRV